MTEDPQPRCRQGSDPGLSSRSAAARQETPADMFTCSNRRRRAVKTKTLPVQADTLARDDGSLSSTRKLDVSPLLYLAYNRHLQMFIYIKKVSILCINYKQRLNTLFSIFDVLF